MAQNPDVGSVNFFLVIRFRVVEIKEMPILRKKEDLKLKLKREQKPLLTNLWC